jgi:hypothetical protein
MKIHRGGISHLLGAVGSTTSARMTAARGKETIERSAGYGVRSSCTTGLPWRGSVMCILNQSIMVYCSMYRTKQDNCVEEMTAFDHERTSGVQKAHPIAPSPAGPSQTPGVHLRLL